MADTDEPTYRPETLAVHAGQARTQEGEMSEPIFASSSYVFASAAEAAARFSGEKPGNIYSRFTNPTVRVFEQRIAVMEGGERAVATASGMAAILAAGLGLLKNGDHIVSSNGVFGSTVILFNSYFGKFGIETSYVPLTRLTAWRAAIRPTTRWLFLETPANPLTEVADIVQLAALAHEHGCLLVVDNTVCTSALQRPLDLGADIVVTSATKYIDGQGRGLGGAVIGREKEVGGDVYGALRTTGPSMSPFHAWLFLKGLETLSVRMQAHSANALALAQWLEKQPEVDSVYYPGLRSHPQHDLAKRQQRGFGGLLSFEVKGGRDAAWKVIDNTRLISITANLGDAKSTITHPATTTHGRLTPEARAMAGIKDSLVRVAVGLENAEDLKADLARGLNSV
jgi:O-succinylhomoserine sulfhydrylase